MYKNALFVLALSLFFLGSCAEKNSRLPVKKIPCPSLENALFHVDPQKKLAIYLPPTYYESQKEYPVIYYLPGFTSPIDEIIGGEYEGFKIKEVMDELIAQQKIKEMIVVLCEGGNFMGGHFYSNSPLIGNAEDYIVEDVVQYIDHNYRTIKTAAARGITGHSMGGYGAFNIASKYPDVFSVCYSISPGIYNKNGLHGHHLFDTEEKLHYLNQLITEIQEESKNGANTNALKWKIQPLLSQSYESYYLALALAYGSAFCFDLDLPFPHIQLPQTPTTGENGQLPTFQAWQNGLGHWEQKIPVRKSQLQGLQAIAFDCGKNDRWISEGSEWIIDLLETNEIEVDAFWHEGGHDDRLHIRLKDFMLPYFSKHLSRL